MQIFLPEEGELKGVLYLLHGLTGNYLDWGRFSPLAHLAENLPLLIVIPEGGRSYYANYPDARAERYEDHIMDSVRSFIEQRFHVVRTEIIGGLSMGGYGAVMLALRHPDVFAGVSAHSSPFFFTNTPRPNNKDREEMAARLPKPDYDCFALARKFKEPRNSGTMPHIRFDCGSDDYLVNENRAFRDHLETLDLPFVYNEYPGKHNWNYWNNRLPEILDFAGACAERGCSHG
ncbi:MAG: hypothetical protein K9L68_02580 [Spirochaetales bacterium]|nr:hypothetical protein [Spirochaetales bacterium]MCF7937463.1 hypothetical protein [Spirochaetales bacterium]